MLCQELRSAVDRMAIWLLVGELHIHIFIIGEESPSIRNAVQYNCENGATCTDTSLATGLG